MLNKVTLIGRLGANPEIRTTTKGTSIANFSIATKESWKDKQGQKQERTEWHKVVVFGKVADVVSQYVTKGSQLYIAGKLQTRKWEKDGEDRYTTEIVIDISGKLLMLDSKNNQSHENSSSQPEPELNDNIPF